MHFHPPSRCVSLCLLLSLNLCNRIPILCRCVITPVWCQHSLALLLFQSCHSIARLSSFLFQSQSRDHPLHRFHNLPKLLYLLYQPCHLPTPLAFKHTSAPFHLRPGVGATRAAKLCPAAAGPTYQMPAGNRPTTLRSPHVSFRRVVLALKRLVC